MLGDRDLLVAGGCIHSYHSYRSCMVHLLYPLITYENATVQRALKVSSGSHSSLNQDCSRLRNSVFPKFMFLTLVKIPLRLEPYAIQQRLPVAL